MYYINRNLPELLRKIELKTNLQVRMCGGNYKLRCPAHNDNNPSLSIKETPKGKILVRCHTGCDYKDICAAVNFPKSALRES